MNRRILRNQFLIRRNGKELVSIITAKKRLGNWKPRIRYRESFLILVDRIAITFIDNAAHVPITFLFPNERKELLDFDVISPKRVKK